MSLVFTEYVRELATTGVGGGPSDDLFDAVWGKFRDALIRELKQRSLWTSPPSYLGVYGYTRWSEDEALEELLVDGFVFAFVERLPSLEAQLKVKDNIEGLLFRSLRNFLYDTQKKHDPLGFRVFMMLEAATLQGLGIGLYVSADVEAAPGTRAPMESGSGVSINNETVLSFGPETVAVAGPDIHLSRLVATWIPDLLPDLVLAKGKRRQAVIAELTTRLLWLSTQGVEALRFKDLITFLKQHVRSHWQAIWLQGEGEIGFEDSDDELRILVRLARPDPGPDARETFRKVIACVEEAPDHHDGTEEERQGLQATWDLLKIHAAEPGSGKMPSQRRIGETLGIPRHHLPRLLATLRRWLGACREKLTLANIDTAIAN